MFLTDREISEIQEKNTRNYLIANRKNNRSQASLNAGGRPTLLKGGTVSEKLNSRDFLTTFSTVLMPTESKDKIVSKR